MGFIPVTSTGVCLSACAHSARVLGPPCRAAVQSTARKKVWARRRAAAQHAWPLRICCCRREAMLERQCQLSASELLTAREQLFRKTRNRSACWARGCVGLPRGCRIACEIQSSATLHSRFVFTITAYCKNAAGKAPNAPSPTQALVTPTR